jgi:hypothetical protein
MKLLGYASHVVYSIRNACIGSINASEARWRNRRIGHPATAKAGAPPRWQSRANDEAAELPSEAHAMQ